MADRIDNDYVDFFTDNSVRYSRDGIQRLATQNWRATVAMKDKVAVVGIYYDGTLTPYSANKPVPLSASSCILRVRLAPNGIVAQIPASSWTTTVQSGVYNIDLSSYSWAASGAYVVEVVLEATYQNPAVSAKTSVLTDTIATYPEEVVHVAWTAVSMPVVVTSDGHITMDGVPAHDHFGEFAFSKFIPRTPPS